jgi:hypothetical protein
MLPKTKPADPWADYEVQYTPFSLIAYSWQYADTIKNKQARNCFTATIKRLLEPETPFLGLSGRSLHPEQTHPTDFKSPIIKSFLAREVVAGRTPSPALIDLLSHQFPHVCYTKRTSTLTNSNDMRFVYNSIFEDQVPIHIPEIDNMFFPSEALDPRAVHEVATLPSDPYT